MTQRRRRKVTGARFIIASALIAALGCGPELADTPSGEPIATISSNIDLSPPGPGYFQCAAEGQTCPIGGNKYTAFGTTTFATGGVGGISPGAFTYKSATGNTPCTVASFGADPAPGFQKSCYFSNLGFVANQNEAVGATSRAREIAYGANGRFNFQDVPSGVFFTCDDARFGDPTPGFLKACYYPLPDYSRETTEGGTMTVTTNSPIAFGAQGKFLFGVAVGNGVVSCHTATFGGDPAPSVQKHCYKVSHQGLLANEGGFMASFTPVNVLYGSGLNGNFLRKSITFAACSNGTFGGDPDPGAPKRCWRR